MGRHSVPGSDDEDDDDFADTPDIYPPAPSSGPPPAQPPRRPPAYQPPPFQPPAAGPSFTPPPVQPPVRPPFVPPPVGPPAGPPAGPPSEAPTSVTPRRPGDYAGALPPDLASDLPDDFSSDLSSDFPDFSADFPDMSDDFPIDLTGDLPDDFSADLSSDLSADFSERFSERFPEGFSGGLADAPRTGYPAGRTGDTPEGAPGAGAPEAADDFTTEKFSTQNLAGADFSAEDFAADDEPGDESPDRPVSGPSAQPTARIELSERYWGHDPDPLDSEDWHPDYDEPHEQWPSGAGRPGTGRPGGGRPGGGWAPDGGPDGPQSERGDWSAATVATPISGSYPAPSDSQQPPGSDDRTARFVNGNWQGGHRGTGRRGVSIGVIVALVTVVVVVAGVISWRFFGDALSSRSGEAADRCVGGDETVAVVADPSISDKINQFAEQYNQTAGPVGDHCVRIEVKAADADTVLKGFTDKWPSDLGTKPALWIPGSSVSIDRLEDATGSQTVTDSKSLVTSPVLLAIKPQLRPALDQQNWGTLPGLQTNPTALNDLNLPGWGSLRLALPTVGAGDASYVAGEAVAAASTPPGAPATGGAGAVNTLISGQPQLANGDLSTAINALLAGGDPAAGQVHAVVVTEQQLYLKSVGVNDAKNVLGSWLPPGPVALADYPLGQLSGDWVSKEQATAANEFSRYLRKPEQLADLALAGFRAEGTSLPKSDVVGFAPLGAPLNVGDAKVRVQLANAVNNTDGGPAVTIMLDQSMPVEEGGEPRLINAVAALKTQLQTLPPTSAVGLWTFDGVSGRAEVPAGLLSDQVDGQPRSAALTAALDKQFASDGGAVSFTTLQLVYDAAKASYRADVPNSVLVVTAGPHTDQSLDGPGLEAYVKGAFDPAKPIAINVIDFGDDPDQATWAAVAAATGGNYKNLPTSASPDLAAAVATFMG